MDKFYKKKKKLAQIYDPKTVDYKDVNIVSKFINEKGKILPRRMTGATAADQKHIAKQVKRARFMALIADVK